jgi:multidrug efflux pump subunit AcrA (membrane-fusion protein)
MRILAPFAGVMGERQVSAGQYVDRGQPLVDLVDKSMVKIAYRVPERRLSQIQLGQEVRVTVSAYPDRVSAARSTWSVPWSMRPPAPSWCAPWCRIRRPAQARHVRPRPDLDRTARAISRDSRVRAGGVAGRFSVYVVNDGQAHLTPVVWACAIAAPRRSAPGLRPASRLSFGARRNSWMAWR